jgi:hypothetical protein
VRKLVFIIGWLGGLGIQWTRASGPPPHDPCVLRLGRLITQVERMPARFNNPGALRLRSGTYRTFSTVEEGREAMYKNIERLKATRTWRQVIRIWSESPERYEAAIDPYFASCLALPKAP